MAIGKVYFPTFNVANPAVLCRTKLLEAAYSLRSNTYPAGMPQQVLFWACNMSKAATSSRGYVTQVKQELETQVLALHKQNLLEHDKVDQLGDDLKQVAQPISVPCHGRSS